MLNRRVLITGGAGFIGSHLIRLLIRNNPDWQIFNYDLLTYAGNLLNLTDLENHPNYTFIKGDICDHDQIYRTFIKFNIDAVIHLAAESHVDRSISDPLSFVKTNVLGTVNLLNVSLQSWKSNENFIFYHVSTDEVYGSLGNNGFFTENSPYEPHSPYSASKASSDHFVRAYHDTYGLPVKISNCSNNYGPNQFPEKLIPLTITNIIQKKEIPVYGKGENIRDWLWVEDHCRAIELIFKNAKIGQTYNIGGFNEHKNINVVRSLCQILDNKLNRNPGESEKLIRFVTDRLGHDQRYAIDCTKINSELQFKPSISFEEGLKKTVDWYLNNPGWIEKINDGSYLNYYDARYSTTIDK